MEQEKIIKELNERLGFNLTYEIEKDKKGNIIKLNVSERITGGISSATLGEDIFKLKHLKVLLIEGNELSYLPKEIGNLKNLEILDISYNHITKLPREIFNLKKLKVLRMGHNGFRDLPRGMNKLKNLEILDLMDLPAPIGNTIVYSKSQKDIKKMEKNIKELVKLNKLKELYLDKEVVLSNKKEIYKIIKNGTSVFSL